MGCNSQSLSMFPPNDIKWLSMVIIFAQKCPWITRQGNNREALALKPLMGSAALRLTCRGRKERPWTDCPQVCPPGSQWLCWGKGTSHYGAASLSLAEFPKAANTHRVPKRPLWSLVSFPPIRFGLGKTLSFFCSFLGIPCNNRTFKCGNEICFRKQNAKCDGTVDCPDGSDEEGCSE